MKVALFHGSITVLLRIFYGGLWVFLETGGVAGEVVPPELRSSDRPPPLRSGILARDTRIALAFQSVEC